MTAMATVPGISTLLVLLWPTWGAAGVDRWHSCSNGMLKVNATLHQCHWHVIIMFECQHDDQKPSQLNGRDCITRVSRIAAAKLLLSDQARGNAVTAPGATSMSSSIKIVASPSDCRSGFPRTLGLWSRLWCNWQSTWMPSSGVYATAV